MADAGAPVRNEGVAEDYTVACPDVIDVLVDARPALNGRRVIGPDGCLDLGGLGRLRVEGARLPEVAKGVATRAGVSPSQVH
ncbi:MAG TPA: polysaccharide biosynthesis/export family protein, partial [Gemmataceae bacterium]|nr:polysaccharide biosynthesis/export family protein [Gemmataceae bacterium]